MNPVFVDLNHLPLGYVDPQPDPSFGIALARQVLHRSLSVACRFCRTEQVAMCVCNLLVSAKPAPRRPASISQAMPIFQTVCLFFHNCAIPIKKRKEPRSWTTARTTRMMFQGLAQTLRCMVLHVIVSYCFPRLAVRDDKPFWDS